MSHIKRKYIDSHWLVFVFQGAIALLFGCLMLFTSTNSSSSLIPAVGTALLALSVVEFANSIYRSRNQEGWLISLLVAAFDAAFGLLLLFVSKESMPWHISLLAAYTLIRGVFEVALGFRTTEDPVDRFIWILTGIAGIIFAFAIFNSGHLQNVDFLRFFGAYLLIFGTSSLIYSISNREQLREYRAELSASAKKRKKAKK